MTIPFGKLGKFAFVERVRFVLAPVTDAKVGEFVSEQNEAAPAANLPGNPPEACERVRHDAEARFDVHFLERFALTMATPA